MKRNDDSRLYRVRLPRLKLALALLLWLPLVLLLAACNSLPKWLPGKPAPPPVVPPLPAEARQVASPTHSESVAASLQRWRESLTTPSSAAAPASGPTKR
jgi:hypothetical protein